MKGLSLSDRLENGQLRVDLYELARRQLQDLTPELILALFPLLDLF